MGDLSRASALRQEEGILVMNAKSVKRALGFAAAAASTTGMMMLAPTMANAATAHPAHMQMVNTAGNSNYHHPYRGYQQYGYQHGYQHGYQQYGYPHGYQHGYQQYGYPHGYQQYGKSQYGKSQYGKSQYGESQYGEQPG
jgi:hypothetical protein